MNNSEIFDTLTGTYSSFPNMTFRDPLLENKKVFYTEMLEFLDTPEKESVGLLKMIETTDSETLKIFKELFKVIFDRQMKIKYGKND